MGNTPLSSTDAEKDLGVYIIRLAMKAKSVSIAADRLMENGKARNHVQSIRTGDIPVGHAQRLRGKLGNSVYHNECLNPIISISTFGKATFCYMNQEQGVRYMSKENRTLGFLLIQQAPKYCKLHKGHDLQNSTVITVWETSLKLHVNNMESRNLMIPVSGFYCMCL